MTGWTRGRLAAVAVALMLTVAAAGCGGDGDSGGSGGDTSALKIGLIVDVPLYDKGFNELSFRGLQRAKKDLGVDGRAIIAQSSADYIPNITTLVRQGYKLVIGVGYGQGDAIATAAKKFPDVD